MKNLVLFSASVAAVLAVGCNKLPVSAPSNDYDESEICELKLCLNDGVSTKVTAASEANEAKIQNVQVFVFRAGADDKSSVLDACLAEGFGTELNKDKTHGLASLKCTVGKRHIFAIVNADVDYTADGSIGTVADLLAKTMTLSAMRADKLLMIGSNRGVTLESGSQSQKVTVTRACASVILESVKNEMQAAVYRKTGSFKIKNIYLTNVPAQINFGQTVKASSLTDANAWYARMSAETDSAKKSLIYDAQTATVLDYDNKNATVHTFYSFPNDCEASTADTWSQRATKLVVEAEYNDGTAWHTCYYPITLYKSGAGLEANKQYKVNLTINRPGSDNPDKPVEFSTLSGTITVADWAAETSYEETI